MLWPRIFQWWEDYIQVHLWRGIWYTKDVMNCSAAWLQEDSSSNLLLKLLIRVISSTRRKYKIIFDPSIYLLLIVIFKHRSDLLLLYVFEWCCDIQNCPKWNLMKCIIIKELTFISYFIFLIIPAIAALSPPFYDLCFSNQPPMMFLIAPPQLVLFVFQLVYR